MISNHITSDFEVAIGHIMNGIEVCKLNENFTITYVNGSFLHLTGYSPDEILDCGSHKLFMHDNDFENFKSEIHHNLKTHNDFEIEYKIIKKDSRSIWVLDKCSIKKASDENIYLYHVITDISNQKEKEQLLLQRISELEREKQYGTTMASNQLLTYEANVTQNSIISVNPDWAREFGITSSTHFSDLVISIAENAVAPEHRVIFLQTLSRESIISAFEENRHILSIEYLKHINNNQFRWFRKNINIIQDNITKDISIRCYIADIDDKKSKELKAFEEQRLYETMRSKADIIYEINVTKNRFITGHDAWVEIFGVCETGNYSQMMKEFSEKALHPDDREGFKQSFMRKHVLEAYENGTRDIVYEYRRPDKSGEYIWVCCTMHLFSDPDTQEIRGHSYVENINEKKEKQLELIYKAEHDLLTGFYNKAATEKYITDFLSVGDGKVGKHAFIIIDVDYFKSVNDNFGHAFGDAVLSQFSAKVRDLFREIDILGRIGGDEFVVFMKNIQSSKAVLSKAQEICTTVNDSFNKNGSSHRISASIGIAFYSEHGKTYQELYKNSDAALYISKQQGRDQYTVYNDNMCVLISNIKAIDPHDLIEPKSFEQNIIEYVFRILYEADDKNLAINSVLELIGKHFHCDRVYIFEHADNGLYMHNTFEWCSDYINSQLQPCRKILPELFKNYNDHFDQYGIFFLPDTRKLYSSPMRIFIPNDVKSILQFSLLKNKKFVGLIGFDQYRNTTALNKNDISVLQNISNILSVFMTEMRTSEETAANRNVPFSIINSLCSYAYVCDPSTFKILFANDKALDNVANINISHHCYKIFANKNSPCEICPVKILLNSRNNSCSTKFYNSHLGVWLKVTATWVDWLGGKKMCLVDITNISTSSNIIE